MAIGNVIRNSRKIVFQTLANVNIKNEIRHLEIEEECEKLPVNI